MKHNVCVDLKRFPKLNEIYDSQIWDNDEALVEFSDMCLDTFESGFKKGFGKGALIGAVGVVAGFIVTAAIIHKKSVKETKEEQ